MSHQVHSRPVDPGDVDPETVPEMQLPQGFSIDFAPGDGDTAGYQFVVQFLPFRPVHFYSFADEGNDGIQVLPGGNDEEFVVFFQVCAGLGDFQVFVGMKDTGYDKFFINQGGDFGYFFSEERGVFHQEGDVGSFGCLFRGLVLRGFGFFIEGYAEYVANQYYRQDDANHSQRISHGVSHGDGGHFNAFHVVICLLGRTQSGSVGHGAGKDAHHGGDRQSGNHMDDVGGKYSQQNNCRCQQVERDAAFFKGGEEAGAYLQSDGVDKEYQSEFLEEMKRLRIHAQTEMAANDADEEYPGDAEGYSPYFNFSQEDSYEYNDGNQEDGMSYPGSE